MIRDSKRLVRDSDRCDGNSDSGNTMRTTQGTGNEAYFKQCSRCRGSKPLSEFYSKGDRFDAACKECQRTLKRQSRELAAITASLPKLFEVQGIIDAYETRLTQSYVKRLQEINDRCEKRLSP